MSLGSITLSIQGFKPLTVAVDQPLDRPLLGYVLRNYERVGFSRPTQISAPVSVLGLPDTNKMLDATRVPLTEALQWYWFGLLREWAPTAWTDDQVKQAWKSLTHGGRAFTNGKGWNNGYADYISGVNLDASPMSYEPIITGGNVVMLVTTTPTRFTGEDCYQILALDPLKSPSTYTDEEWLVFKATISRRDGYNTTTGKWTREDREIRFPQLGGVSDVPVPLWTKGGVNYIQVSKVRVLGSSEPIPPTYIYA